MSIQESGEMYLETLRILSGDGKAVRAIDVGEYMGYSKPSVSRAMKILKDKGLIEIDSLGHISLTDEGARIANTVYERHKLLTSWLLSIGVDEQTADADACRIEHCISDASFEAIKAFMAKSDQ